MLRAHSRLAFAAVVLAPLGVSCSSSTTDPSRNTGTPALSAGEAGTVATGLLSPAAAAVTGAGSVVRNSDGSYTAQCPGGGTITAAVRPTGVDFTTNSDGSRNFRVAITATPQACVVGTGARQIAITGDPSVVLQSVLRVSGTTLLGSTNAVTGAFKWAGGSCPLDYTATTSLNGSTQTATIVGTVCGQRVNTTKTF